MNTHYRLTRALIRPAAVNCLAFALLLACAAVSRAQQEATPKRGFQSGGSYALGDIETVNTTNGNVMLRLPLASLPAGRGGFSGPGVTLTYNSKLYDSRVEYRTVQALGGEIQPDPNNPQSNRIPVSLLQASDEGGWRLGYYYALQLTDRQDQYPPGEAPCELDSSYRWKLQVVFPDGGAHDMAPVWYTDYQNNGHYKINPNGQEFSRIPSGGGNCYENLWQASTTGVWYWATDGSNVRLHVGYDGDPYWQNNPWTLYLPGGGRVTGGNSPQRFYDRNDNYSELQSVTLPDGRPATRIADQLGRYVQIDSDLYLPRTYVRAKGANATELVWTIVWKDVYVQKQYKVTDELGYTQGPETFFHILSVVDKVIAPNPYGEAERAYTFGYNAPTTQPPVGSYTTGWGEVNAVTLPTGAAAAYQWVQDGQQHIVPMWRDVLANSLTAKTLTYLREYDGQTSQAAETWSYQFWNMGSVITAPDGGTSSESFHDIQDSVNPSSGLSYLSARPDGSVVERIWLTKNLVKTEFTSVRDAAGNLVKTAIKDYEYDCFGNVKRAAEYDWVAYGSVPRSFGRPTGLPAGAQPKRVTTSTYHHDPCTITNAPRILNSLKSQEVSEGGTVLSRTEFFYDDPLNRGNLTKQMSWDSAKAAYSNPLTPANSVSVSHEYDDNTQTPSLRYGNRTRTTDARGVETRYVYGPVGGHSGLYPTETRVADNYPSLRGTTQTQYDFLTGLATRVTDADNGVAEATSYDAFGRPMLACEADNVPAAKSCTATAYSDSARRVIVKKDLSAAGDAKIVSVEHFDQLGRVRLSRQLEDVAAQSPYDETHGVKVQTRYAYSGPNSYQLVSNPYRAAYSHQAVGGSMGWSRSKSDRGGRIVETQTFSGSSMPAPWGANASSSGAVTTAYDAEFTTVTDQAGKVRRSMVDGLGRLARVDEPVGDEPQGVGDLGPAASPLQPTYYTYDANGNLTQVQQGTQTRTFAYSSLSRLTSATNPESGTVSYTYDANGNLKTKTDARGVTITYGYDELNRSLTVDYSHTTGINPDIRRYYDNPAAGSFGKGRFWYDYAGGDYAAGQTVEHVAVDAYDALGRPLVRRQHFKASGAWSAAYQTSRQYNRSGGVVSQTYPSGRTVSYGYDAAGRLSGFSGNLGDGTQRTYSDAISYDEAGRMREERFGTQTPLYHKQHYNARGQLYDVRLSTVPWAVNDWDWDRGVLALYYGTPLAPHGQSNSTNNGNVARVEHWIPGADGGPWAIYYQEYQYDPLNRLKSVTERKMASGVPEVTNFTQAYSYDRWGNRQINAGATNGVVNATQFEMAEAATKNRILAPGDMARPEGERLMRYDAAGNLIYDGYLGAGGRAYDAENRMTGAWGPSALTGSYYNEYRYDADGRRVRRKTESGEVWQVYGLEGELLAEYASNAAPSTPKKEYGYRGGELLITAEADYAWVDDALPAGAWHCVCGVNEAWNWVGSPAPVSGSYADQMAVTAGLHQQFFEGATQTMQVGAGETLVAHVYLDPANPPSEIMIQWNATVGGWEHRAYWGANLIGWGADGTQSRRYMGPLPAAGQWVRLEVPAAAVGLEGKNVHGLAVTLYNGRATWDKIGKGSVRWLVSDHLGTPRMTADQTGSLAGIRRHDYLPFGEEVGVGIGGRTAQQGYVGNSDALKQRFTGKLRDDETELDYFLARYYSATHGRFTSPDEFAGGPTELFAEVAAHNPTFYADLEEPQSLNKYQYALNNPLKYVDPDGHQATVADRLKVAVRVVEAAINTPQVWIGSAKAAANIVIGARNFSAESAGAERIEPYRASNLSQAVGMSFADRGALIMGFAGKGNPAGMLSAEVKPTAAVAVEVANGARASKSGAAGALTTQTGEVFTATSVPARNAPKHAPGVQKLLDNTTSRGRNHGGCCEPQLVTKALNKGVDPTGGTISVVRVRRSGNPQHGTPLPPCPSCKPIVDFFKLKLQ